jgi:uncharacterized integral membrane protein
MTILRNVVALLALGLLLVLALTNAAPVKLSAFGYQTPELPLFVFLLIFFALGYLLAALAGAVRQTTLRRQVARLERELARGGRGADSAAGGGVAGGN